MATTVRYHVLESEGKDRVMIFDAQTGKVQHPACWQDISAYYHYLLGRGDEAQNLLAESMAGSKPITRMVEELSKPKVWGGDMCSCIAPAINHP